MHPIKILERRDFIFPDKEWSYGPLSVTGRFIDATKEFWTQSQFEDFLAEMMGERITFETHESARITVTYFVQQFMKAHEADPSAINLDAVLLEAVEMAKSYIHRMDHGDLKFLRAKPDEDESFDENAPPVIDDRGNRKRKKGAKKQMAAELYQARRLEVTRPEMIALFMEEIGMSKAGATTYFHNNKAEYGPCKEA